MHTRLFPFSSRAGSLRRSAAPLSSGASSSSNSSSPADLFAAQQQADYTASQWGAACTEYDRAFGRKLEAYAADALRLLQERRTASPAQGMGDVLDVGCGPGAVMDALCHADAHGLSKTAHDSFTGIDFSLEMVRGSAEKCARVARVTSPRFLQMDGMRMEFADCSFDTALAMFSLLFFPDKERGMREMLRVLRPGGVGAVGCWGHTKDLEWVHYGNKALVAVVGDSLPRIRSATQERPNFQAYADRGAFEAAMARNGWAKVAVHEAERRFAFATRDELKQMWLDMSVAYPTLDFVLSTFPEGERDAVRAAVAEEFAGVVHRETGVLGEDGSYGVLRGVANIAVGERCG